MKKTKLNYKFLLEYLAIFFVCVCLANSNLNGLSPFLFVFFFAGLFAGLNEKLLAVFTICSSLLVCPTLENALVAITVVFVGLVMVYVHKLIKKNLRFGVVAVSFLISLASYIYYNHTRAQHLLYFLILAMVCLYVYSIVLCVLCERKNCFKLTLNESICFLFAIATLSLGFADVYINSFSVFRLIVALIVLLLIGINQPKLTFAVTISLCFGMALNSGSLSALAEFSTLALLGGMFSLPNKYKVAFVFCVSEIVFQFYFNTISLHSLYTCLPVIVASILFLFIPKKLFNSISDFVFVKSSEISCRNLINTTRKSIKHRLTDLSTIFLDMKQIHLNMVKKVQNKDELVSSLVREVSANCCKDCLDKHRCTRSLGIDSKSNLEMLVERAVEKGKITLLDLPAGLTSRCGKVNSLVSLINRLSEEYKQYKLMVNDVNNVKMLLADQMGAVSQLLLDLGKDLDRDVSFDIAMENKIISSLLTRNIECKEVLLFSDQNTPSVIIVTKQTHATNAEIEEVLSEVLRQNMQIVKVNNLNEGDFVAVTLKRKSNFDCVFGLSACNKAGNELSGDCHSIIRLSKDRFLLALCDGMGAGNAAHKTSAMTLGLIENFYKAGFDNDTILESVNKLLAINNGENYSTLDVCLIDLSNNIADFIKVGSPFGLIKHENGVETIEGGALPIGALESISPTTRKTTISTADLVIMATDGITDAFINAENMVEFVSHLATNNPQTISEAILSEALRLNNNQARDDMTVLVARTYKRN